MYSSARCGCRESTAVYRRMTTSLVAPGRAAIPSVDNPLFAGIIGCLSAPRISRAHFYRFHQEKGMRAFRFLVVALFVMNSSIAAQWLKHPTADIPRTADGKPDLAAPTPRQPNGRPVLAGLWRPAPGLVGDMTRGLKAGEVVPFQPWAEALFKERRANSSRDDPTARCVVGGVPRSDFVGYPFKILERPEMVVILYEAVHSYRQIFTDGRRSPRIRTRTGLATPLDAGRGTFWSSSRAGSTTTSGWTTPAARRRRC